MPPRTSGTFPNDADNVVRYPSLAVALVIKSSPTPTTTIPMARATRSPFGASRSAVIAAVTRAITRRSMTPMTRRIAVKAAQPQVQWRPRRSPCRQAVAASAGNVGSRLHGSRQQVR